MRSHGNHTKRGRYGSTPRQEKAQAGRADQARARRKAGTLGILAGGQMQSQFRSGQPDPNANCYHLRLVSITVRLPPINQRLLRLGRPVPGCTGALRQLPSSNTAGTHARPESEMSRPQTIPPLCPVSRHGRPFGRSTQGNPGLIIRDRIRHRSLLG